MGETVPFRRTWRVTVLRGLVASVPAVALAALIALGQPDARRLPQFGESLLGLVMLPALWLVLGGAWLAHKRAARGPGYLLRAHILGSLAALALAVVGSMVIDTVTGNEGMHGLSLVFWIMVIPPWVAIGFAAAGLVPGSFSSGSSRVRAWRRAARPMPTELALVKDSHDAQ